MATSAFYMWQRKYKEQTSLSAAVAKKAKNTLNRREGRRKTVCDLLYSHRGILIVLQKAVHCAAQVSLYLDTHPEIPSNTDMTQFLDPRHMSDEESGPASEETESEYAERIKTFVKSHPNVDAQFEYMNMLGKKFLKVVDPLWRSNEVCFALCLCL